MLIIVAGALFGSVKGNVFLNERLLVKVINIIIGVLVGVSCAEYIRATVDNQHIKYVWIGVIVSLTSSLLSRNFIEMLIMLTPKDLKRILIGWIIRK